jgi:hypothetical protein
VATSTVDTAGGAGKPAGDVRIDETSRLVVTGGGRIDSSSFGRGAGGKVLVRAGEVVVAGAGSAIATSAAGSGAGGSIDLQAVRIEITDGGAIGTETAENPTGQQLLFQDIGTFGLPFSILQVAATGRAGSLFLVAEDSLVLRDASITSESRAEASGSDAGRIAIDVGDTLALERSRINAASRAGFGGSIAINGESIGRLPDGTLVAVKDPGEKAARLVHLRDSEISTSVAGGGGDAGNVLIDPAFIVLDGSRIVASAKAGDGGNILLVADAVFADAPLAEVLKASSETGVSGTVDVRAPDVDLAGTLGTLPESFLVPAMPERCAARASGGAAGSFVLRETGGIGPEPDGLLAAPLLLGAAQGGSIVAAPGPGLAVAAAPLPFPPGGCR